jgi:hypothetical protein
MQKTKLVPDSAFEETAKVPPSARATSKAMYSPNPRPGCAALTVRAEASRPWRAYAVMHLWRGSADTLGSRKSTLTTSEATA